MTFQELSKLDNWELGRLLIAKSNEIKELQEAGSPAITFQATSKEIKLILELLEERGWIKPKNG